MNPGADLQRDRDAAQAELCQTLDDLRESLSPSTLSREAQALFKAGTTSAMTTLAREAKVPSPVRHIDRRDPRHDGGARNRRMGKRGRAEWQIALGTRGCSVEKHVCSRSGYDCDSVSCAR